MNWILTLFILVILNFTIINCSSNVNKRHIHNLVRPKQLNHNKQHKDEFLLRCPKISKTTEKPQVSVAWIHNNVTVFSIINDKIGNPYNLTIKRWYTLKGYTNVLANSTRIQFEYEEARNWYAVRIKHASKEEVGLWKCRMIAWFEEKRVSRRYESRKRVHPSNKSEFFTFKKRNLSDPNAENQEENPVTFTKPNADFTVFSRMSKFNEVAYNRRTDKSAVKAKLDTPKKNSSSFKLPNTILILLWLFTLLISVH